MLYKTNGAICNNNLEMKTFISSQDRVEDALAEFSFPLRNNVNQKSSFIKYDNKCKA